MLEAIASRVARTDPVGDFPRFGGLLRVTAQVAQELLSDATSAALVRAEHTLTLGESM